jgi:hypothetical protein
VQLCVQDLQVGTDAAVTALSDAYQALTRQDHRPHHFTDWVADAG